MRRTPCPTTKTAVRRAIEAARKAGLDIARVEVAPDGRVIIVAGKPVDQTTNNQQANEWDTV
jgi:hypothetical protein